ncbi:MAG: PKD domain-containing protein, partial [Solirubrobacteraceae bacterium]
MAVAKGPPFFVQVASRPAGAAWSAVQELGQASQSPASLAIDPSGTALVAFVSTTTTTAPCTNGNGCLQIWIKPPGVSTWSQEKLVAAPAGTAFFEPSVAIDPNSTGNAAVVWNTTPSAGLSAVQAVQRTAGVWGVLQSVNSSNTETYDRTRVAIDSAGTPVALWASSLNTCPTVCSYQLRTAAFNGSWQNTTFETNNTEKFDSATGDLFERRDGQGTVSAIWIRTNATTGAQTIRSATHPLTATPAWGAPSTVETLPAGSTAFDPRIAIASDGETVGTWGEQAAGGAVAILSSVRPPGGSFAAATTLDNGTNVNAGPDLAMDGQGTATVVWRNAAGGTQRFAVHPHGGSFGGTFDAFTGTGTGRTIADADPAGHVSAVWAASTSTVQTQVYDAVAPVMPALPSPLATTPTNALVSFDTSATDVWSNPVSIHWDFGDGASADGASATHAYALPGLFTPKAVASDASGNSAAQTSQIQAT